MLALRSFFYFLLKLPLKFLVRCKIITDSQAITEKPDQPIFYIVLHKSASDLLTLQRACKKQNLPDPLGQVTLNGTSFDRTLCLANPTPLFSCRKIKKTTASTQGLALLKQHTLDENLDAKLIPANLIWGKAPTKERRNLNIGTLIADQESPSWLRKFFIVLFLGRDTLVRFSESISLRDITDNHGSDEDATRKFLRVARFHFHRQTIAAKGPRLMHRKQMFTALLANPSIKRIISDEAKSKKVSEAQIKKEALAMMNEIAGDYNVSWVRFGEVILHWLWARLYSAINVSNAKVLRKLAQDGHEIIYVPCHRSHMDYLLLSYVIIQEGLVMPRIAAGINLNFWPAGTVFRKAGAFFIRRSFGGNRLYSTIFREYLGLLFERGYSVKYYTEGGRSRTGRLLTPKTGMLAMSIQSLLRGIDRPLTLVPVYLGYEHVMEVGTYHKELSGSEKKGESIFGVLKAIKNLRNYGNGYVNFGEPMNINEFLNEKVPNWKDAIDPIDPQKPTWLTPTVNELAENVMENINKSAALNGVALIALILQTSKNKALSKVELETQLDFFLNVQRQAPFSKQLTVPKESAAELIEHVISLNKVTITEDSFGSIISLSEKANLEMRYYRNNILHSYVVPALTCRLLDKHSKINQDDLIAKVQVLASLLKEDLYLYQDKKQIEQQTLQILNVFEEMDIAKQSKAGFWSLTDDIQQLSQVHAMADCVDESLQRLAIITSLISRLGPLSKRDLETKVVAIAQRLSVLNSINAPEFIDKRAQSTLISTIREQGYIEVNEDGLLVTSDSMAEMKATVVNLVDIEVLQSIAR
ncbi:glycerol-3-phosphate 1-O-acyltransferase PlsB [Colwellia sp. E2M01]|uniref:glycerol-3-phosphate 1-O-acyltransferase PlsB n=1 Tax=Colwellia sp. E2M01 TaxID=2841561 RepID=UPI001C08CA1E|nr:glycerol-3-phosphate 1-O-acyltransferase PlsB [Colwellia sp. E2M01]MBU2872151.1 glycerol-3-phosphate 1-O-acyltransferase PlsB [Colwellia sp. E2M01]